jgi:hypothetical protein
MKRIAILALLLGSPALAGGETDTLSEADKVAYLKCAYVLNGNSGVRSLALGSIDLSGYSPDDLRSCITPPAALAAAPAPKKPKGPSR